MPDAVSRAKPDFRANVSNRPTTARPAVGQPMGPRGIPCSVLCPPDPPPPAVPLAVVSVTAEEFASFVTYAIVFDGPIVVTGMPNWTITGGDAITFICMDGGPTNRCKLITDLTQGSALVVPVDATGVHSVSGGAVVPGSYPVV